MLSIIIPVASSLVINAYSSYRNLFLVNKFAFEADQSLRKFRDSMLSLKISNIRSAEAKHIHFRTLEGEDRYFLLDDASGSLKYCKEDCEDGEGLIDDSFGYLAKNVNYDNSTFIYYNSQNEAIPPEDFNDNLYRAIYFIKLDLEFSADDIVSTHSAIFRPSG